MAAYALFFWDDVLFESIDLSIQVEEIYSRVQNEDMLDCSKQKGESWVRLFV